MKVQLTLDFFRHFSHPRTFVPRTLEKHFSHLSSLTSHP